MKSIEEIAQWVINNRYPKNELEKVSDAEMYQTLVQEIYNLLNPTDKKICTCKNADGISFCKCD
jgi:hypothetical protein